APGMELGEHRPWVLQSTLETEFPLPLYSDQYITLWGPRQAPLLKQAVRWKTTPIGWDAVGQSWSTGLNSRDEEVEDPWYALASGVAHRRWERAHAGRGERDPLPPAYAQHLREVAWWDPVVPAAYLGPCTRWGPFLWQERPVLGKEYVGEPWAASVTLESLPVPGCSGDQDPAGVPKPRDAGAGPGNSQQQVDEEDGVEEAQRCGDPGP
uniref:Tektin bundle interacting protein 1 n=1 Tax=Aquila chrysaetos chrysaetos TaxID=223781 RepID=A0A663EZH6_AQUCH